MTSFTFDQLDSVSEQILKNNNRLILIAGASASGKSHIAEEILDRLSQSGKKVLLISSDNYYNNNSSLQYLLYGTFDHPNMIDYTLLGKNIIEYFQTGKTQIPSYSFVEKRRTDLTPIDAHYDIVLVEGLYTINKLSAMLEPYAQEFDLCRVFVHADLEEIIFRRIMRDQKRVTEPLHMIVDVMAKVFPMRNVFGQTQAKQSDIIIENTFQIMDKEGKKSHRKKISSQEHQISDNKYTLEKIEYINDYIYNDDNNDRDCIIISEVYEKPDDLLHKVTITKRQFHTQTEEHYDSISLDMYEPGIVTVLHSLIQLAGLSFIQSESKKVYYYETAESKFVYKEKNNIFYQLLS